MELSAGARSTASLTLAFDHRVCDGAEAGRFLGDLRRLIEEARLPGVHGGEHLAGALRVVRRAPTRLLAQGCPRPRTRSRPLGPVTAVRPVTVIPALGRSGL